MTSLRIGYFTVPLDRVHGFIDGPWLQALAATDETDFLKHVHLPQPVTVMIDGRKSHGVILKPAPAAP